MAPKRLTNAEKAAQMKAQHEELLAEALRAQAAYMALVNQGGGGGDEMEAEENEGEDFGTPTSQPPMRVHSVQQETQQASQSLPRGRAASMGHPPRDSTPVLGRGTFSRLLSPFVPTVLFPPTFATPTGRLSTGSNQTSGSLPSGSTQIPEASNTRSGTPSGAGSRASGRSGPRAGPVTLKTVPQTDPNLRIALRWNGKCFDVVQPGQRGMHSNSEVVSELSGIMTNNFDGAWWKFPTKEIDDDRAQPGIVPQAKVTEWLNDFRMRFRWPRSHEAEVVKFLRGMLRARLNAMISRPRKLAMQEPGYTPGWAKDKGDLWARILAGIGGDTPYLEKCERNKKNRNVAGGGAQHSTGRRSHVKAVKDLENELGRMPTPGERLFCTHGKGRKNKRIAPDTPLDQIEVQDAFKPVLEKCKKIMADLHGPECNWTVEDWDDCLAYLEVPVYKGNMPGFSHKTRKDIAKARRNRLRSEGIAVSDTTEEEEGLGENDEDVNSVPVEPHADIIARQAALEEKLARINKENEENIAQINKANEEWRQELVRQQAKERFEWEQEWKRKMDLLQSGAGHSRWMEPGSGSGPPADVYRPQMHNAYQPTQLPQQGFPNPPGPSFFDGLDENRYRNDEENEYVNLLREDDTGRNVANPSGTPRRGRGRGRRSSQ